MLVAHHPGMMQQGLAWLPLRWLSCLLVSWCTPAIGLARPFLLPCCDVMARRRGMGSHRCLHHSVLLRRALCTLVWDRWRSNDKWGRKSRRGRSVCPRYTSALADHVRSVQGPLMLHWVRSQTCKVVHLCPPTNSRFHTMEVSTFRVGSQENSVWGPLTLPLKLRRSHQPF